MQRHLKFLPKEALETIYFKTVIPCVTYGIAVWGSCSSSLLDDLESIHIRAARVIHNIPKRVKKHDILSYVGWQSLKYIYTKRLLILAQHILRFGNSQNKESYRKGTYELQPEKLAPVDNGSPKNRNW